MAKSHHKDIFLTDDIYPHLLKNIFDPPKKLHVWGEFPDFDLYPPIAVVGSRKPTEYGRRVAHDLAASLAEASFCVVSGLAYGIDSIAHSASLEKGGKTVAVLGSGLDNISPSVHKKLAEEIVNGGGTVISEFDATMPGLPHHFPKRNRIISGLSFGVIIVEAAIDSGSLITARSALEQGREVFAVPGPIGNVNTAGTHRLLRDGAALIETVQDVVDALDSRLPLKWKTKFSGQSFGIGDKERKILDELSDGPVLVDNLVEKSGLAPQDMLAILTTLECAGLIKEDAGLGYVKVRTHD